MADGLLIIGDVHISVTNPQRRIDDYFETVTKKLRWCMETSVILNCVPVILGDLFDKPTDIPPYVFTKLFEILSISKYKPVILAGNHDLRYGSLFEKTALETVEKSGLARVAKTVGYIETEYCSIYTVPYGQEVPKKLEKPAPMITHHEWAFVSLEKIKKGNRPLMYIENCPIVFNGHLHSFQETAKKGDTVYFNTGSIVRLTKTDKDLKPTVWEWKKGMEKPIPHTVPHEPAEIALNLADTLVDTAPVLENSEFAANLQQLSEKNSTEDASLLAEILLEEIDKEQVSVSTREILKELFRETTGKELEYV